MKKKDRGKVMNKFEKIILGIIWFLLLFSVFNNMVMDSRIKQLEKENKELKTELINHRR